MCNRWFHRVCLFMPEDLFTTLKDSNDPWYCTVCLSIKANKIKWGDVEGEVAIRQVISSVYNELINWRKNLFLVPRGKAGTDFIKELARLMRLFTTPNKWTRLALAKVHIFIPLMLQKPTFKCKAKDHARYLDKWLKLWNAGDIKSVIGKNREIQK